MKWQGNANLIFKTDQALEKEPLTVDPDYQEEFEEYPEDYEDELEFPGKDFNFLCLYIFTYRPQHHSCLTFGFSQSATSIHRNTRL